MKNSLLLLFMLCCMGAFAQEGITFEVEKLSKPEKLLPTKPYEEVYKNLILSDIKVFPHEVEEGKIQVPFNIIAKSEAPAELVYFTYHSFFDGMYRAYADHRPFVLSPDMVWLLICQGFAQHVDAHKEEMRHYFTSSGGKLSLIVEADKKLDDPSLSWEKMLDGFNGQIRKYAGDELVDLLTCNFSTTTSLERIASEITIMKTVEPYFEFILMYVACGIPQITLEGTPEDWEKVADKAQQLKQYGLDWWIVELEPLLKEFVKASKGQVNKKFWRNMFKYHSQKKYGAPNIVDGWIVKFFPYDKHGKRNDLKQLKGSNNLPEEIVKVDVEYQEAYTDTVIKTPLEIWAGFVGLEQNEESFALRPQIGWMVRKKDVAQSGIKSKLEATAGRTGAGSGIHLRVKEFPAILLELKEIKRLELDFVGDIHIPDEFAKVKVEKMILHGRITEEGAERIKRLFPYTDVVINNTQGHVGLKLPPLPPLR